MNPALLLTTAALLFVSVKSAAEPALSAEKVLSKAETQATAEHKSIFLMFDASW